MALLTFQTSLRFDRLFGLVIITYIDGCRSVDLVIVYFQMNYGLFLYLKLARVDVGNVSKKGGNMEGIIN